ncbi:hypothetical protein POV27_16190 [Aureisphaera galaxeae]|uniref:DUF7033 domain-containing protein n=1 Tax=Aureisphaera galaxeae TaxID=1538023 RepID=UPI00234FEF84|nr:hypothetical protein [Aureisphaera galaxeae]MDC8005600.1 hypothetical protein [Aureisphaera galaxeae]
MLLVYTQKQTPRLDYSFKHICTRILGYPVSFTSVIEEFIAHQGPKLSYGKQPMGNELFIQAHGLLFQQGFEDVEVNVSPWEDTIGFFGTGEKSALPFDIFAATFYLLSRYEEYMPHVKDELGRFPAEESLAYKEDFLKQPVVDKWAFRFQKVLLEYFPTVETHSRSYMIHHVVQASRPFEFSQRGFLRNVMGYGRDLIGLRFKKILLRSRVLLYLRKDPYDTFTWIINASKKNGAKLSVFFLLGEGFTFREDINAKRKKVKLLVKQVADYTYVGLVFSFHSLMDMLRLKMEKKEWEELIHRSLGNTMNDRFKVGLPSTYRNLLELEIKRDFSMLYDSEVGFRAGTCTPFLFYDLDYEIKTPLIIHPVCGVTGALYNKKAAEQETTTNELIKEVKQVNGTFSLVFSNKDFTAVKHNKWWKELFSRSETNE